MIQALLIILLTPPYVYLLTQFFLSKPKRTFPPRTAPLPKYQELIHDIEELLDDFYKDN